MISGERSRKETFTPPGGPKQPQAILVNGFSLFNRQAPVPSSTLSIRRFCALPCAVSFGATGCVAPNPLADKILGLTPFDVRNATTVAARRDDKSRLSAMPTRCNAGPTGVLSVKP